MAGGRTGERVVTRATKSTEPADAHAQQSTLRERQQSRALQEKIAKVEKREAWTKQYQLGKDHTEFEGMGCGTGSLIGPYAEFTSPFCGTGRLEVSEGSKSLESGSIRICRGPEEGNELEYMKKPKRNKIPDHQLDIFMFPSKHIESITLTPSAPEDSTVGVVITSLVPAGDTDLHKTPQPVTLQ